MILRKPYALFIKYFKLMHLIMVLLTGYLIYKTGFLYAFFNEKITAISLTENYDLTDKLFNSYMFIIPFIIIIINLLILSVLAFKKKPYKFYVLNIIIFIGVIAFNGYFYDVLGTIETGFVEVRTLRLVRDFIMFTIVFEGLTVLKNIVSATGFDVKKFDFRKDLEELKIDESDREEFEFEVKIDTDAAKRTLRGNLRRAKYVYLENRFIYNLVIIISVSFISFTIYFNLSIYNKTLSEKQAFTVGSMSVVVNKTNIVNTDYKGIKLKDDKSLVIVEVGIKNNYDFQNKLELARVQLDIKGSKFIHTNEYRDRLFDIGITYDERNLSTSFKKYILVYEIPNSLINKKMIFMYYDNINYFSGEMGPSIVKINLNPNNLESKKNTTELNLNDELKLREPLLNSTFKISSYAIEKYFALDYNFCLSKDDCFPSKEYIVPGYNGNSDLSLLKLNGTLILGKDVEHVKYDNYFKFLSDFAYIEYSTSGIVKQYKIQNEVKTKNKTDYLFLEVPSELFNSEKIRLVINIRDNRYIYTIK